MAERRLDDLQRVLGVNALTTTAYVNVGSSMYYTLGLVAGLALGLTPVVFVIAGIFFFATAATYAEATAMFPETGGSSSFARNAFNELVSFVAGWAQMLGYVVAIAIAAFFAGHYVGGMVWEPLRSSPGDVIFGAGVVALLAAVNVVGAKQPTRTNAVLAVVDLLTQLALVVVGAVLVLSPDTLADNVDLGAAPTWRQFILSIPVAMIAYAGIGTIADMAEGARGERTTIVAALGRARLAVYAVYFTLPAVALSALPVTRDPQTDRPGTLLGAAEEDGGFAGDPIVGVVKHLDLGLLQGAGELYVGLLAATILLIGANAGIVGVSRLVYSMGLHRQVPDPMRRLHSRFGTPSIGILVFAVAACLVLLPGDAEFLANTYAFGAMLSFTIAHAAVVRLRWTEPERDRPYRMPGTLRVAGRQLPGLALFGGIATGSVFVVVTVLNPEVALAGMLWLAIGAVLYAAYRRRQGLDLTTTTKVSTEQRVVAAEAEYDSILVAVEAGGYRPQAVATAAKLAARRRRGIYVLVTISVPQSSPLDARMPKRELAAGAVLEQAKLQGGRRVSGRVVKVRPGQAGRLIIDEARRMHASAIVLPLPPRRGPTVFGKTLETVLAERPCRVIIESDPAEPERRATPSGLSS